MTNWTELKRLAEEATQGTWRTGEWMPKETVGRHQVVVETDDGPYVILEGNQNFMDDAKSNAAFVAAANPKTILALIAENERLKISYQSALDDCKARWTERDQARAEVDGLLRQVDTLTEWYANGLSVINECASVLPGTHYMDPPDGGDVPVPEQLRRMAKDAERYRHLKDQGHFRAMSIDMGGNHSWTGMGRHVGKGATVDEAIDAEISRTQP